MKLDDINGVFKSAYDGDLNACIDYINNNEKAINDLISETKNIPYWNWLYVTIIIVYRKN